MTAPATHDPRTDHPCSAVRALASRYLDGRLSATSRARVHAHLKECSSCLDTYRSLQRLSTMARALPRAAVPADLARRVRRTVSERRQETLAHLDLNESSAAPARGFSPALARIRARTFVAAAAVVIAVAGALFAGYKLGRMEERADTEGLLADLRFDRDRFADQLINASENDPSSPAPAPRGDLAHSGASVEAPRLVEIDPGMWKPYRERGFHPEQFVRSARTLWSDLASFDAIEPQVRRPLLAAQLACFELPAQARIYQELSSSGANAAVGFDAITRFVRCVEEALASEDATFAPGVEFLSSNPFAAVPAALLEAAPPETAPRFLQKVDESVRIACSATPEDSALLEAVRHALRVKAAFVDGESSILLMTRSIQIDSLYRRTSADGQEEVREARREEHSTAVTSGGGDPKS